MERGKHKWTQSLANPNTFLPRFVYQIIHSVCDAYPAPSTKHRSETIGSNDFQIIVKGASQRRLETMKRLYFQETTRHLSCHPKPLSQSGKYRRPKDSLHRLLKRMLLVQSDNTRCEQNRSRSAQSTKKLTLELSST